MTAKAKVPPYYNWRTYRNTSSGEINKNATKTVKGQTHSVAEILERFGQGIEPKYRKGYYGQEPDIDYPDPTLHPSFDMVDAYQLESILKQNQKHREKLLEELEAQKQLEAESQSEEGNDEGTEEVTDEENTQSAES